MTTTISKYIEQMKKKKENNDTQNTSTNVFFIHLES